MTPIRLVLFRLFLIFWGWIPPVGVWLHKILVSLFVKRSRSPYGASSRFYTPEDLT